MADINFKVLRVAASTAAAGNTQDFTISGFGTPKAAIFYHNAAITDEVLEVDSKLSTGYTDGTKEFAIAHHANHGTGVSATRRIMTDSGVIISCDQTDVVTGKMSFNSWITDGVRLDIDVAFANAEFITVVLINGSDVQAHVDEVNLGTGTSAIDVTAPGFEPDIVFMSSHVAPKGPETIYVHAYSVSGVAINDGSNSQKCLTTNSENGQGIADCRTRLQTNRILTAVHPNGSILHHVLLSDFDANGFSLTPSANTNGDDICYLALGFSGNYNVGTVNTSITATGDYSIPTTNNASFLWLAHIGDEDGYNQSYSGDQEVALTVADSDTLVTNNYLDDDNNTNIWTRSVSNLRLKTYNAYHLAGNGNQRVITDEHQFNHSSIDFPVSQHSGTTLGIAFYVSDQRTVSDTLGIATEEESAPPLGQAIPVGIATEDNSALPVTLVQGDFVDLGIASEQESAPAVTSLQGQFLEIGIPTENNIALELSPTDNATLEDASINELLANEFCFEITANTNDISAGTSTLTQKGEAANRSIIIQRDTADLKAYISSDGTNWDILDAVIIGTLTTAKFYLTIERIANEIIFFFNGVETYRVYTELSIFDSSSKWFFGTNEEWGSDGWDGIINSTRLLIGSYRYGSEHSVGAVPFADSDSYAAGTVYSENFALHWNDIASSSVYGLGAEVDGLVEAKNWNETILEGSCEPVPIGHGGLTLPTRRKAEYYLDLLAEYANCVWYPYNSKLRIQPDHGIQNDSPAGQEVCLDREFDSNTNWIENGWVISSGVASIDGLQVAEERLQQTLSVEIGVEYSIGIEVLSISGGDISINFGGVEVLAEINTVDEHYVFATGVTTTDQIEIIAPVGVAASLNFVSVRRKFWLDENWIDGTINISFPSDKNSPTAIRTNFKVPSDDSPNWVTDFSEHGVPAAEFGNKPYQQTKIDLPGLKTKSQASNKSVRRLARMYKRVDVTYTTRDYGILRRVGDAIQVKNDSRGIDLVIWVENVEFIDYGRYKVTGIAYEDIHFSLECALNLGEYSCSSLLDTLLFDLATDPFCKGVWWPDNDTQIIDTSTDWYFKNYIPVRETGPTDDRMFYAYANAISMQPSFMDKCGGNDVRVAITSNPAQMRLEMASRGDYRKELTQTYAVIQTMARDGLWPTAWFRCSQRYRHHGNLFGSIFVNIQPTLTSNVSPLLCTWSGGSGSFTSANTYDLTEPHFYMYSHTTLGNPVDYGGDWKIPFAFTMWIDGSAVFDFVSEFDISNSHGPPDFDGYVFDDPGEAGCDQPLAAIGYDSNVAAAFMLERKPSDEEVEKWFNAYRNNFNPPI